MSHSCDLLASCTGHPDVVTVGFVLGAALLIAFLARRYSRKRLTVEEEA